MFVIMSLIIETTDTTWAELQCDRFSWKGLGSLAALRANVTAQVYLDILSTFLMRIIEDQFGNGHCVF